MKSLASNVRSALQSAPEVGPLERLRRGSVLCEQEQDSCGLFLIENGLLKLIRTSYNGSSLILSIMGPHQVVGVESLMHAPCGSMATAICLTDVLGYRIPLAAAKRIFGMPEFANGLLNYLLLQDEERISRIERQSLYEVEQRILYVLADLAQMVRPSTDGSSCPIPMTQLELAGLIGATRETTSTTLSNLQARNLVKLGRRLMTTVQAKILIDAANSQLAQAKKAE